MNFQHSYQLKGGTRTWVSRTVMRDKLCDNRSFIARSFSSAAAALASASYQFKGQN